MLATTSSTGEGRATAIAPPAITTASDAKREQQPGGGRAPGRGDPGEGDQSGRAQHGADRRVAHGQQQRGRTVGRPHRQRDEHLEQHAEGRQRHRGVQHGLHADTATGRPDEPDADQRGDRPGRRQREIRQTGGRRVDPEVADRPDRRGRARADPAITANPRQVAVATGSIRRLCRRTGTATTTVASASTARTAAAVPLRAQRAAADRPGRRRRRGTPSVARRGHTR